MVSSTCFEDDPLSSVASTFYPGNRKQKAFFCVVSFSGRLSLALNSHPLKSWSQLSRHRYNVQEGQGPRTALLSSVSHSSSQDAPGFLQVQANVCHQDTCAYWRCQQSTRSSTDSVHSGWGHPKSNSQCSSARTGKLFSMAPSWWLQGSHIC